MRHPRPAHPVVQGRRTPGKIAGIEARKGTEALEIVVEADGPVRQGKSIYQKNPAATRRKRGPRWELGGEESRLGA